MRHWVESSVKKGHNLVQISSALNAVSMADNFIRYSQAFNDQLVCLEPTRQEIDQWYKFWINRDDFWRTLIDVSFDSDELIHKPSTHIRWIRILLKRWPHLSKNERYQIIGDIDLGECHEALEEAEELTVV